MLAQKNAPACSVCGSTDARTLSTTPLASGSIVVVCGSHAVAHARLGRPAETVAELRKTLADRRDRDDRRDRRPGDVDELAASLASAFTAERRGQGRRRVDA